MKPVEEGNSFFDLGKFTMPSGKVSDFKIECDMLTEKDWAVLAHLAASVLPPFGQVEGVPRGGIPFAEALGPYATMGPLLIAEDVWVEGISMTRFRGSRNSALGVVAFARGVPDSWVVPVFQLHPGIEVASYGS